MEVTPHAGVWIETEVTYSFWDVIRVTPHAGVWIETNRRMKVFLKALSLPTRECGLKRIDQSAVSCN